MSKKKKKNHKHQHITIEAFDFVKTTCLYCGKRIKERIFCSEECQVSYFKKKNKMPPEEYVSKKKQDKRRIHSLSDILDKEQLEEMIKESKNSIDKKMKRTKN